MTRGNEQARALFRRGGQGSTVAIAVDTRPKTVKARKGPGSYTRKGRKTDARSLRASDASRRARRLRGDSARALRPRAP